jgi:hypothetical protein
MQYSNRLSYIPAAHVGDLAWTDGRFVSEDDPSLIGMPEHGFAIAEMMCLHACGEGEVYSELLQLIEAETANTQ